MGHGKGEHCPEPLCKVCGKLLDPLKPHKHTIAENLDQSSSAGNPLDPSDTTVAN